MAAWSSAPAMQRQLEWHRLEQSIAQPFGVARPAGKAAGVEPTQTLQVGKGPNFGRDRRQLALAQVQPLQPLRSCATRSGMNETR